MDRRKSHAEHDNVVLGRHKRKGYAFQQRHCGKCSPRIAGGFNALEAGLMLRLASTNRTYG